MIDFSRVGVLLFSGTHHYTWEQIKPRLFIVLSAMAVWYGFGWQYGLATAVITHISVIVPLITKRWIKKNQCLAIKELIDSQDNIKITSTANLIFLLAQDKPVSSRWGYCHRVLSRVQEELHNDEFWKQDLLTIIDILHQ